MIGDIKAKCMYVFMSVYFPYESFKDWFKRGFKLKGLVL